MTTQQNIQTEQEIPEAWVRLWEFASDSVRWDKRLTYKVLTATKKATS